MAVNLQSERISLLQSGLPYGSPYLDDLWNTFRRIAVEPAQASTPDLLSFADECLLCAQIALNVPEYDESLWDTPISHGLQEHDHPQPSTPASAPPDQRVGLVYLHAGPANIPAGEVNVGVIIKRGAQGRGYAREAVQLVLRWAFEELKFHRVQAAIFDTPFKDRALRLFIGSGFAHEGTKRRAVYQPDGEGMVGVWKDVTYLAMLDTEWMLRSHLMPRARDNGVLERPVVSVWDEMFARHSREQEELARWEEKHGRVKKTSSTETLREDALKAQDLAYLTDDAASSVGESSCRGSLPPSPRLNFVVTSEDDTHMTDAYAEADQGWEHVVETSFAARRQRQGMGTSFLEPSPRGPTLALPSIPSTRLSDANPQSPLTIPSPSSMPPFSASPSPASFSVWDDEDEDEDWLRREDPTPRNAPIQFTMPHDPREYAEPSTPRTRSRSASVSSSGTDSWSDAQSSVGTSWDVVSNSSDHGGRL